MTAKRKTVVIVDDHDSVRRSLERLLRSCGWETRSHGSAEEFLEHARPSGPSCLVLDVRLPGASGLELQEGGGSSLPIVFITGHADVPVTVRAMKSGAVDLLVKPFEDSDLIDAVERALERDEERLERLERDAETHEHYAKLTPREREVFELVVTGLLNKQIALRLGVSEKTVKVHRGQVMRKLNASSVPDLVRAFDTVREAA